MILKRRWTPKEKHSIHKICGKIAFSFISLSLGQSEKRSGKRNILDHTLQKSDVILLHLLP